MLGTRFNMSSGEIEDLLANARAARPRRPMQSCTYVVMRACSTWLAAGLSSALHSVTMKYKHVAGIPDRLRNVRMSWKLGGPHLGITFQKYGCWMEQDHATYEVFRRC